MLTVLHLCYKHNMNYEGILTLSSSCWCIPCCSRSWPRIDQNGKIADSNIVGSWDEASMMMMTIIICKVDNARERGIAANNTVLFSHLHISYTIETKRIISLGHFSCSSALLLLNFQFYRYFFTYPVALKVVLCRCSLFAIFTAMSAAAH